MPYTIVDVIYGYAVTPALAEYLEGEDIEDEDDGFHFLYAQGDITGWSGVKLSEFDDATSNSLNIKSLKLEPSKEDFLEAEKQFAKIPDDWKPFLGERGVHFVFASS